MDCHVQDLVALHPLKNVPPCRFGIRWQDPRSLIVVKINASNFSPKEKRMRLQNYNELALKTFIHGLAGQLQNIVCLKQAMAFVVETIFLYSLQKGNFLDSQNHRPANSRNNYSKSQQMQSPQPLQNRFILISLTDFIQTSIIRQNNQNFQNQNFPNRNSFRIAV